jgi:hypothetical protein
MLAMATRAPSLVLLLTAGAMLAQQPATSPAAPAAHSPYYFRELKIDASLHLILTGGINLPNRQEPDVGSYYAPFHGAWTTSVDHFERKPGAVARERSLFLETDSDQVLDRTVKTDEILRGPFGSIDAVKECFYTRPIQSGFGSVSVEFNVNDKEHELPSEVSSPAEGLPALTSLSMVRIFGTGPEYVIVSANYERDGGLGSVDFGSAKDGHPGGTRPLWNGDISDPRSSGQRDREKRARP